MAKGGNAYHGTTPLMHKVHITDESRRDGIGGSATHGLEDTSREQGVVRRRQTAPHGAEGHKQRSNEKHWPASRPV